MTKSHIFSNIPDFVSLEKNIKSAYVGGELAKDFSAQESLKPIKLDIKNINSIVECSTDIGYSVTFTFMTQGIPSLNVTLYPDYIKYNISGETFRLERELVLQQYPTAFVGTANLENKYGMLPNVATYISVFHQILFRILVAGK